LTFARHETGTVRTRTLRRKRTAGQWLWSCSPLVVRRRYSCAAPRLVRRGVAPFRGPLPPLVPTQK